ncbi:hypothetical protein FE633_46310 [Streptomyces montanus]|uniref:Activator of Hsp90 ATPase homologue 1/2-like C-terminal domain-containing protein n=1 Tax=Streptomyces montanus TaxID=2580423 RepID=A0A5R9F7F7_9ACTN|nr:SRPBCC domain-containing protein [Streptomyces montanus]TLS39557.1 hypothetical protein FE633_46310 [Streptomyces montanus]
MSEAIEQGTGESRGGTHTLHFTLRLPQPVENVWPVLAGADGLRRWLAAAEPFEPRLGGAVTLHGLGAGRVTAWDVERVAEYTVDVHGRIRFHLEPAGERGTTLRFTNEFEGDDERRAQATADWRDRFERLVAALPAGPEGG